MITPPWQTTTTVSPGCASMTASSVGTIRSRKRSRVLAAVVLPPAFDHRLPAVVLRLAQLLHRDVVVGVGVPLLQPVERSRPSRPCAAATGCRGLDARGAAGCSRRGAPAPPASHAPRRAAWSTPARGELRDRRPRRPTPPGPMRIGSAWRTSTSSIRLPSSGKPSTAASSASAVAGSVDLDRGHPERARRLEVHAEVVEEHGLGRRDAEPLAHELVDARDRACAALRPRTRRRRRTRRGARARAARGRPAASLGAQLFVSAPTFRPVRADGRDRAAPSRAAARSPGRSRA